MPSIPKKTKKIRKMAKKTTIIPKKTKKKVEKTMIKGKNISLKA